MKAREAFILFGVFSGGLLLLSWQPITRWFCKGTISLDLPASMQYGSYIVTLLHLHVFHWRYLQYVSRTLTSVP